MWQLREWSLSRTWNWCRSLVIWSILGIFTVHAHTWTYGSTTIYVKREENHAKCTYKVFRLTTDQNQAVFVLLKMIQKLEWWALMFPFVNAVCEHLHRVPPNWKESRQKRRGKWGEEIVWNNNYSYDAHPNVKALSRCMVRILLILQRRSLRPAVLSSKHSERQKAEQKLTRSS